LHYVDYDSDNSSDKFNVVYVAKFVWPSKAKSCDSLKLIHKNQHEEVKYTFDVAKCDKIFDVLCHTLVQRNETEASIRVSRKFKSHVYNFIMVKHIQCYD
jgi:hypothetical protein